MKRILFMLLQCTWGIGQTLIGFLFFLIYIRCPHKLYRGCIDTRWNSRSGLSLGLFIFTPDESIGDSEEIRIHEYGHCLQSVFLGPLYIIVGIISVSWARMPYFERMRREKKLPYTACFVESWASRLGEWLTGEKAIWD